MADALSCLLGEDLEGVHTCVCHCRVECKSYISCVVTSSTSTMQYFDKRLFLIVYTYIYIIFLIKVTNTVCEFQYSLPFCLSLTGHCLALPALLKYLVSPPSFSLPNLMLFPHSINIVHLM